MKYLDKIISLGNDKTIKIDPITPSFDVTNVVKESQIIL